jgi:cellulose synthase/poly-beta-1,6-N-acetylglucosamine synthase-like glycosyltransferase
MEAVFWSALGLVVYVYAGYPLVLAVWARLARREWPRALDHLPAVSIVLAVRNEASRLPGRIENLLALDYPAELLDIIVVSDGSMDRTAQVLAPYAAPVTNSPTGAAPRVRFLEVGPHGKASALNVGVAAARHDILVFADARQRFAADAVRHLVADFADPTVGAVSGELVLDCEIGASESTASEGVGGYWRYEKWLRARESAIDSMIGATGAIYAMRRACWRPLPDGTILDDLLAPMRAVLAGWRVVFEPRARAFDVTALSVAAEWRRKTRTLAGNYQVVGLEPKLLVPGLNRVWLQYVSHKLGRLVVPWALMVLLLASIVLASSSTVYLVAMMVQVVFYALAAYGAFLERRSNRGLAARDGRPRRERKAVNV